MSSGISVSKINQKENKMLKLIVLMLMCLSSVFASKSVEIKSINDVKEGSFLVRNENGDRYKIIPTVNTSVSIDIKGMVSSTTVDQTFTNDSSEPIEAIYVFPLPPNSAVNNMTMIIGDRVIQGIMKEKMAAKKTYEDAKKQGKRATLTDQQRPNIFTNKVANVMPGDNIIVRIQYVNELKYDNGKFSMRFPMVVAPRYIDGSRVLGYSGTGWSYDTDIVPDASQITPKVVPDGMRSGNKISLNINLDAGLDIRNIMSTSHEIIQKKIGKGRYQIKLKKVENIPNKDFVIEYDIKKGKKPKAALFVNEFNDENYFMLMAMPPKKNEEKAIIDKEIIFVIDISGSMQGVSIEQAKRGLEYSISELNSNDYFNIIAYNDNYFLMSDYSIPVSEENILNAFSFINSLNAGGGTRALAPLIHAMNSKYLDDKIKMILFITDGDLGYERKVFEAVDTYLGNSRLFSVGIGTAPNGHLLEKVSQKGRGTYTYINNIGHVNAKMKEILNKIDMPVLTDVALDLDSKVELYPNPLPDLFVNEPLVVFGKIKNDLSEDLTSYFSGKTSDGFFRIEIPISISNGVVNDGIKDIWARKKIDDLIDDWHLGYKDSKQKIIDLSIKHNLMSKFTSFVAVEEKIVNPGGNSMIADVHVDLPEGWDYNSVFGSRLVKNNINKAVKNYKYASISKLDKNIYPKTATNMPYYLFISCFLFLLSFSIFLIKRFNVSKNI